MYELLSSLLDKPLAFIITVSGIIFLGLSGLTKIINIEIDTRNSKRLFIAGISLVILGIPIYYYSKIQVSSELTVDLLKVEFFKNDKGHTCSAPFNLHVRETYEVEGSRGEKLTKVILNQNTVRTQEINYQDSEGNFAVNYCFKPNIERVFKIVIISNSGKTSNMLQYKVASVNQDEIQENAPELSTY